MTTSKVRIPHLEDLIFEGKRGHTMLVANLADGYDYFRSGGVPSPYYNVTAKWDGAPAIICGQHPETNRFFVSTKSFWNNESKVNYTEEDIGRNHESVGLQRKLSLCLAYLPELNIQGVLQGDMMYERKELYKDKGMLCFKPNVVEYKIPLNTLLAHNMIQSQIGIVFHTSYGSLMEANYKVDIGPLNWASKNVWFRDASLDNNPIMEDIEQYRKTLFRVQVLLQKCSGSVINTFTVNETIKTLTKRYINDIVRQGKTNYLGGPALHNFIAAKVSDSISEAVKPETKANRQLKLKEINHWFQKNAWSIEHLLTAYNSVIDLKNTMIESLNKANGDMTEGYVVSTPWNVVKLIDRPKFSYENFNDEKEWKSN